ncbi:hypothetical protein N403_04395 [Helicobacter pylori FD430]|nr:hypothetical protein N403_04395 [Helicobacter pylori FD430]
MIAPFNKGLWANPPKGFFLIGLKTIKPYSIFQILFYGKRGRKAKTIKPFFCVYF